MRRKPRRLYMPGWQCKECNKVLTAEERKYYAAADGSAMCNDCERKWQQDVERWRKGEIEEFPEH